MKLSRKDFLKGALATAVVAPLGLGCQPSSRSAVGDGGEPAADGNGAGDGGAAPDTVSSDGGAAGDSGHAPDAVGGDGAVLDGGPAGDGQPNADSALDGTAQDQLVDAAPSLVTKVPVSSGLLYRSLVVHGVAHDNSDMGIASHWATGNGVRTQLPGSGFFNGIKTFALNKYQTYAVSQQPHPEAGFASGPRGIYSVTLAPGPQKNAKKGTNDGHVLSLLQLAASAAGHNDKAWETACKALKAAVDGGFSDWEQRVILRLAHEHNGIWFAHFSGIDADLVGEPALLKASGYGATVNGLLQACADSASPKPAKGVVGRGDRGWIFQLAFQRYAAIVRDVLGDKAFIDYNFASGSADLEGGVNDNQSTALNPNALPDPKAFDIVGLDTYGRGSNRPIYLGGDKTKLSSWDLSKAQATLDFHRKLANQVKRPLSFPEYNTCRILDPALPSAGGATDAQAAIWLRLHFEWIKQQPDLAYHTLFLKKTSDQEVKSNWRYVYNKAEDPLCWAVLQQFFPPRSKWAPGQ